MAAEADARELQAPTWVRAGLLAASLLQLALGVTLLLYPQWTVFNAIAAPIQARQAIGLLQLAIGGALLTAAARPVRNVGLVGAGVVLALVAAATLLMLAVTGGTAWADVWPLLGLQLAVVALLGVPMRALMQAPEPTPPSADSRPATTTTLFGLQQTLQALAAPATIQLTMFPDLVANGARVMDEFKLWRERALAKRSVLNPQQQEALRGLDECLHRMLGEAAARLWTADAVRSAPEWGQLRASARRALVAFSWSVDMPMGVLKRRRESPSSIDLRPPR